MDNLLSIFLHCKGQQKNHNPGVAPPDCALLFYWPKRVSRKVPTLRWACLARQDGNLNSGKLLDEVSTLPPQVTRLLRASPVVESCNGRHFL